MDTYFAPAGRATPEALRRQAELARDTPLFGPLLDAFPLPVLVLNGQRQVVAANRRLHQLLGTRPGDVLGKRPGEIIGCAFWRTGPDGCGTSPHCLTCGAVGAILASQESLEQVTRECRLTLDTALDGGARDLRVTAAPVEVGGERFCLCTLEDVSQQKRLAVLTRTFFHDVLNTAGGIRGFVQVLAEDLPAELAVRDEVRLLEQLAEQLIGEIESQRDLTRAESGDLEIRPAPVRPRELLEELWSLYAAHPAARGRAVRLGPVWDGALLTDPRLLTRVLGNMIKNALEATPRNGTVTLSCREHGTAVAWSVHNPAVMPPEVQLQVFQRSFTTKGEPGRGIGTYSMKLFGEHYLRGRIDFTSREGEGTTFTLTLPRVLVGPGVASELPSQLPSRPA